MHERVNMPLGEDARPPFGARVGVLSQFLCPQHLLSAMMHHATRVRFRPWKSRQIRWFIRHYGVDMSEAASSDPAHYPDFNRFFTRALRPGARPFDEAEDAVVSPADGRVGQFGRVRGDVLVQAKGLRYSLSRLLGGAGDKGAEFEGGAFVTIYLAPYNYHRVHMPLTGTLREMVHVPGRLFSVGTQSTRLIPNLFTRNERVVSRFDHALGPIAIVLVGALCVGGIEQVWSGPVTPPRGRRIGVHDYRSRPEPLTLEKAHEMGRFNVGSTVVALFGPTLRLEWASGVAPGSTTRVGERIATLGTAG